MVRTLEQDMKKENHSIITALAPHYGFHNVTSVEHIVQGHINSTYRIVANDNRYIVQKINTTVFTRPLELMHNIELVTSHLRDHGHETLEIIPTTRGDLMVDLDGEVYRVYREIEGVISYNVVDSTDVMRKAGAAFGQFQNILASFDATDLVDTIENFHHTPTRYQTFLRAVEEDVAGRADAVRDEIEFFIARQADYGVVTDGLEDGSIPLRVTHNDTKINNVLMDAHTGEVRAIIDLDTVMPGSVLYDFGDALRTGASTAEEDEKDLSKVSLSIPLFEAYTQGFLDELGESITPRERELLPFAVKLLTLETGMRFLTDYLCGDVYFGIHRPEHNLDRARTQIALVEDIERVETELQEIVKRRGQG